MCGRKYGIYVSPCDALIGTGSPAPGERGECKYSGKKHKYRREKYKWGGEFFCLTPSPLHEERGKYKYRNEKYFDRSEKHKCGSKKYK